MTGFGNVQFGNVAVSKSWMLAKSVVLTYLNNGRQISILEGKVISAKVISYHFWSNRARTLHPHHLLLRCPLPLRVGNPSTLPQEHAFIPGQIRWFTGPSLLTFPLCLLSPCHMLFLFSDFIQGKPHFWAKAPIFWTKVDRIFYVAYHGGNCPSFSANPPQLGDHIFRYKYAQTHFTKTLIGLSFDKKLKKTCQW